MTRNTSIDLGQNYIDSRDVEARIGWLDSEGEGKADDESEQEELDCLLALREEFEGYCDWQGGAQLIHEDAFMEHTKELADDCGMISTDVAAPGWPYNCIDWERAADELKQDYTCGEVQGETYYVR